MPHLHRFFHTGPPISVGEEVGLSPEETHHALHVVRLRPGDVAALFDGQGRHWRGTVAAASKRDVRIAITEAGGASEPPHHLTLLQASLHRSQSMEFLVRHGTELGVRCFHFFRAERSERDLRHLDKWQRIAIEACKQCGRLWLPTFEVSDTLEAAMAATTAPLILATQEAEATPIASVLGNAAALIVGPEGDFSTQERGSAFARGAVPLSLGESVFRAEMAAIVATTIVQYEWGGLGPRMGARFES